MDMEVGAAEWLKRLENADRRLHNLQTELDLKEQQQLQDVPRPSSGHVTSSYGAWAAARAHAGSPQSRPARSPAPGARPRILDSSGHDSQASTQQASPACTAAAKAAVWAQAGAIASWSASGHMSSASPMRNSNYEYLNVNDPTAGVNLGIEQRSAALRQRELQGALHRAHCIGKSLDKRDADRKDEVMLAHALADAATTAAETREQLLHERQQELAVVRAALLMAQEQLREWGQRDGEATATVSALQMKVSSMKSSRHKLESDLACAQAEGVRLRTQLTTLHEATTMARARTAAGGLSPGANRAISTMRQQTADLTAELKVLRESRQQDDAATGSLREAHAQLSEDHLVLGARQAALLGDGARLREELERAQREAQAAQAEAQRLRAHCEGSDAAVRQAEHVMRASNKLQDALRAASTSTQGLRGRVEEAEAAVTDRDVRLTRLREERDTLREQLQLALTQVEDLADMQRTCSQALTPVAAHRAVGLDMRSGSPGRTWLPSSTDPNEPLPLEQFLAGNRLLVEQYRAAKAEGSALQTALAAAQDQLSAATAQAAQAGQTMLSLKAELQRMSLTQGELTSLQAELTTARTHIRHQDQLSGEVARLQARLQGSHIDKEHAAEVAAELASKTTKLAHTQADLAHASGLLEDARATHTQLAEQVRTTTAELRRLTRLNEQHTLQLQDHQALVEAHAQSQATHHTSQTEVADLLASTSSLGRQLQDSQAQTLRIQQELDTLRRKLEIKNETSVDHQALMQAHAQLQTTHHTSQTEVADLLASTSMLGRQLRDAQAQTHQLQQELADLHGQLEAHTETAVAHQALLQAHVQLQDKHHASQTATNILQTSISPISRQMREAQNEAHQLQQEVVSLHSQLETQSEKAVDHQVLVQAHAQLQATHHTSQTEVADLLASTSSLGRQLQDSQAQTQELQKEMINLRKDLDVQIQTAVAHQALVKEYAQLQDNYHASQAEVDSMRSRIAAVSRQMQEAQAQVRQSQQEAASLQHQLEVQTEKAVGHQALAQAHAQLQATHSASQADTVDLLASTSFLGRQLHEGQIQAYQLQQEVANLHSQLETQSENAVQEADISGLLAHMESELQDLVEGQESREAVSTGLRARMAAVKGMVLERVGQVGQAVASRVPPPGEPQPLPHSPAWQNRVRPADPQPGLHAGMATPGNVTGPGNVPGPGNVVCATPGNVTGLGRVVGPGSVTGPGSMTSRLYAEGMNTPLGAIATGRTDSGTGYTGNSSWQVGVTPAPTSAQPSQTHTPRASISPTNMPRQSLHLADGSPGGTPGRMGRVFIPLQGSGSVEAPIDGGHYLYQPFSPSQPGSDHRLAASAQGASSDGSFYSQLTTPIHSPGQTTSLLAEVGMPWGKEGRETSHSTTTLQANLPSARSSSATGLEGDVAGEARPTVASSMHDSLISMPRQRAGLGAESGTSKLKGQLSRAAGGGVGGVSHPESVGSQGLLVGAARDVSAARGVSSARDASTAPHATERARPGSSTSSPRLDKPLLPKQPPSVRAVCPSTESAQRPPSTTGTNSPRDDRSWAVQSTGTSPLGKPAQHVRTGQVSAAAHRWPPTSTTSSPRVDQSRGVQSTSATARQLLEEYKATAEGQGSRGVGAARAASSSPSRPSNLPPPMQAMQVHEATQIAQPAWSSIPGVPQSSGYDGQGGIEFTDERQRQLVRAGSGAAGSSAELVAHMAGLDAALEHLAILQSLSPR